MNESAKKRVLVVEDERVVGVMTKAMLESLGYVPLLSTDGAEAIKTFEAQSDEIAFIMLDLVLPDMDGAQLYRRLRAMDPELKCIVSSGYLAEEPVRRLLDAGADDFIQKPFKLAELKQKVDALLDR